MKRTLLLGAGFLATLALLPDDSTAQTGPAPGLKPQARTFDIILNDSGNDVIHRLANLNQDLDFNGAGETIFHYHAGIAGGPATGNPSCVAVDARGHVFIADTTGDVIVRTIDYTGDGSAHATTPVEWQVWLDATNASGIPLPTMNEFAIDANGVVWGTNAGAGTTPADFVWRAEDLNGDNDAQDAGELTIAYDSATGPFNIQVPFCILLDPGLTASLWVSDFYSTPGFYRMTDGNNDGDFMDPGEVIVAYTGTQPGQPGFAFPASLGVGPDGDIYVYCAGTFRKILRLSDSNADGDFEDAGESWIYADNTGVFGATHLVPYIGYGMEVDENGRLFYNESSKGDWVIMNQDLNGDLDAQDAGEGQIVWDSSVAIGSTSTPRALCLLPTPLLSAPSAVSINTTWNLDFKGADSDNYQLLIGLTPLGYNHPLPPYGYLTHDLIVLTGSFTLDGNGDAQWVLPAPASLLGLTVYFTQVAGKLPYRYYMSNGIAVTFVP
ncbi:MAG: hypothetical protein HY812_08540 [Planctomycetes bacterium]|nr:hypothetical protein [Planctomycetota bacterium]